MIALGTRVVCSREAFVIRRKKMRGEWGPWMIPVMSNFHVPVGVVSPSDKDKDAGVLFRALGLAAGGYVEATHLVDPEQGHCGPERLNKGIAVVPNVLSGTVVDRVRRMWGVSSAGSGSGEDYDPGYFEQCGSVMLYVVKPGYGSACSYVPEDSIIPEVLKEN